VALAIGVEHVKLAGDAVWLAAAEGSARTCFQVPTGSVLFWRSLAVERNRDRANGGAAGPARGFKCGSWLTTQSTDRE